MKDYELAVRDFLVSAENLDLALDVAAHLDSLRNYLFDRF